MQIELQLSPVGDGLLARDCHHELASALYQALSRSQPKLAEELHDGNHRSRLKLFVFSLFNSDPKPVAAELPDGTRALKFGSRIWMRFASIWPELVYGMAEALQKQKELNVRGQRFRLEEIRMVPTPDFRPTMTYRPFGQADFIVCRYQKDGKNYFRMPDDSEPGIPSCADLIAGNLRHKLPRLREIRPDIFENLMSIGGLDAAAVAALPIQVEFLPLMEGRAYRTRLTRIKGINVRAFRAPLRITAPEAVHRLVWETGVGSMNSMGFGTMTLGRQ